jgi:hypothetical protein
VTRTIRLRQSYPCSASEPSDSTIVGRLAQPSIRGELVLAVPLGSSPRHASADIDDRRPSPSPRVATWHERARRDPARAWLRALSRRVDVEAVDQRP